MASSPLYPDLSHKILAVAFKVHNTLGCGLPESVYQQALMIEFKDALIEARSEVYMPVYYRERLVGRFAADIVLAGKVILELKSVEALNYQHRAQLLNYLRISGLRLGYLLNFHGHRLEYKRLIM